MTIWLPAKQLKHNQISPPGGTVRFSEKTPTIRSREVIVSDNETRVKSVTSSHHIYRLD